MLSSLQKRILLFLLGCIIVRLLFVYIAYIINPRYLKFLGFLAIIVSIGFITIYLFGLRKTGPETMGQPIWWDSLRPFHSLMYLIFGILAILGIQKYAWIALLVDVLVGLTAFIIHHKLFL